MIDASLTEWVSAGCLLILALAHSLLGEAGIVKPLLAADWEIETPRWATERIVRFAWHLTSLAWVALAAAVLGVSLALSVGLLGITSAGIVFVMLRGHLAWPLFLLVGLTSLRQAGYLGDSALSAAAIASVIGLAVASCLHVYWAAGGRWLYDVALPDSADTSFSPGPGLTLLVAFALAAFSGLVALAAANVGPGLVRPLVIAGVVVFTLRAIGDTKVAGFTKADHSSTFAVADDLYFTPLIVLLALGATAAVI